MIKQNLLVVVIIIIIGILVSGVQLNAKDNDATIVEFEEILASISVWPKNVNYDTLRSLVVIFNTGTALPDRYFFPESLIPNATNVPKSLLWPDPKLPTSALSWAGENQTLSVGRFVTNYYRKFLRQIDYEDNRRVIYRSPELAAQHAVWFLASEVPAMKYGYFGREYNNDGNTDRVAGDRVNCPELNTERLKQYTGEAMAQMMRSKKFKSTFEYLCKHMPSLAINSTTTTSFNDTVAQTHQKLKPLYTIESVFNRLRSFKFNYEPLPNWATAIVNTTTTDDGSNDNGGKGDNTTTTTTTTTWYDRIGELYTEFLRIESQSKKIQHLHSTPLWSYIANRIRANIWTIENNSKKAVLDENDVDFLGLVKNMRSLTFVMTHEHKYAAFLAHLNEPLKQYPNHGEMVVIELHDVGAYINSNNSSSNNASVSKHHFVLNAHIVPQLNTDGVPYGGGIRRLLLPKCWSNVSTINNQNNTNTVMNGSVQSNYNVDNGSNDLSIENVTNFLDQCTFADIDSNMGYLSEEQWRTDCGLPQRMGGFRWHSINSDKTSGIAITPTFALFANELVQQKDDWKTWPTKKRFVLNPVFGENVFE